MARPIDGISMMIDRLELRLEQYRIHAASLEEASRNRDGVDFVIRRLEARLADLRAHRRRRERPPNTLSSTIHPEVH